MVYNKSLNKRQLKVLRGIADGSQSVTSADSALKVTVYALRSRGLVETNKTGKGTWKVDITDAGKETARTGRMSVTVLVSADSPAEPDSSAKPKQLKTAQLTISASELIEKVQAAGNELTLPDLSDAERAM